MIEAWSEDETEVKNKAPVFWPWLQISPSLSLQTSFFELFFQIKYQRINKSDLPTKSIQVAVVTLQTIEL